MSGKLAAGKFLVASRRLDDPNFVRTVVLLLHYDAGGAMGLVVNRPTTMELSKILPEVEELQGLNDALYIGGPVALDGIMLLIRAPKPPEGASNIFDGVHATGKLSTLREMTRRAEESTTFRAYAGHAGWGPGQLDREVALGGWHVVPAEVCAIFDTPASQVWPALIDRVSGSWARAKTRQPGS